MGSFRLSVFLILLLTVYSDGRTYHAVLDGLFRYDLHFFEKDGTKQFQEALLNFALNPNNLRKQYFKNIYDYQELDKNEKNITQNEELFVVRLFKRLRNFYFEFKKVGSVDTLGWCSCGQASAQDRMLLLLFILNDMCSKKYDSSRKIVFTSLATGGAQLEFFIVVMLIELGFKHIEINFIDYIYSESDQLERSKKRFLTHLDKFIQEKQASFHAYYAINWYHEAYDYIKDVMAGTKQKSDILIGTDYGDGGMLTAESSCHNGIRFPGEQGYGFFSQAGLEVFIKEPVNHKVVNFFIDAVAKVDKGFDVIEYQKKVTEELKNPFPNQEFYQCGFKVFDDLKAYATHKDSITYQLHNIDKEHRDPSDPDPSIIQITHDGNLKAQMTKTYHVQPYSVDFQVGLAKLRYKLENLKSKLNNLKNSLDLLRQKLVEIR
ncbi:hypothetical protein JST56_04130 [Candidatus Dependentiae bacterium]|nr:hypothetical protein [Candidatus Dependentiae bacterium]